MTTYVYTVLFCFAWYWGEFDLKLVCIGLLIALLKLDQIRDAKKPKWRLVGQWGDGWRFVKTPADGEGK